MISYNKIYCITMVGYNMSIAHAAKKRNNRMKIHGFKQQKLGQIINLRLDTQRQIKAR